MQGAVERSTFEFMKAHQSQFDEKLSKLARNEACGLPKDAGMASTKLRRGVSGQVNDLSADLQAEIMQKWKQVVEPVTGCATYEDLRKALQQEGQE